MCEHVRRLEMRGPRASMTLPYGCPQDFEGSKRLVWEGEDVK